MVGSEGVMKLLKIFAKHLHMLTATVTYVLKNICINTDMNKEETLLKFLMKYTINNVDQEEY